eukprot:COSAG05_NODE_14662_length_391_cov_0.465753_1_plen_53_part_10
MHFVLRRSARLFERERPRVLTRPSNSIDASSDCIRYMRFAGNQIERTLAICLP